jgi:hypothetical protein
MILDAMYNYMIDSDDHKGIADAINMVEGAYTTCESEVKEVLGIFSPTFGDINILTLYYR